MRGDRLLSAKQARHLLADCGKRKLRGFVEAGKLHPRAMGGVTVFLWSELQALIESIKAQPPGRAGWRGTEKVATTTTNPTTGERGGQVPA